MPLGLAPLTGRDTELSLLKDRWEQAQEGMGQVVLVVGEAGLGKSPPCADTRAACAGPWERRCLGSVGRIRERVGRPGLCQLSSGGAQNNSRTRSFILWPIIWSASSGPDAIRHRRLASTDWRGIWMLVICGRPEVVGAICQIAFAATR